MNINIVYFVQTRKCHDEADANVNGICTKNNIPRLLRGEGGGVGGEGVGSKRSRKKQQQTTTTTTKKTTTKKTTTKKPQKTTTLQALLNRPDQDVVFGRIIAASSKTVLSNMLENANSDQPAHGQSIIRAFALHSYTQ